MDAAGTESRLTIRPMTGTDVPHIVRYWTEAKDVDLVRMGVDAAKIPRANVLRAQLEAVVGAAPIKARSFYMMWLIDGRVVGYCSLKSIFFGDHADMHLHMWDPESRGKGHGAILFCRSALEFFERFRLHRIVCEPSSANPMPNAMLRRVGFPVLGTRIGLSSELSLPCELTTYAIEAELAARYLGLVQPTVRP